MAGRRRRPIPAALGRRWEGGRSRSRGFGNGAHRYENTTPLTNFLELLAIAVLPAALPVTFGRMVGRPRAG
jgi:K+-transporting ATPase A subunit